MKNTWLSLISEMVLTLSVCWNNHLSSAFSPVRTNFQHQTGDSISSTAVRQKAINTALFSSVLPDNDNDSTSWQGEVTPGGGTIRGCSVKQVDDKLTEWIITIDGNEADLSSFSNAIYKKVLGDAKQQRFQGFRPGTIPPHLMTTYIAFTMDECARETVLEAMEQNNVRPFTDARSKFVIEQVSIAPPKTKKKGKQKQKKKNKKKSSDSNSEDTQVAINDEGLADEESNEPESPKWVTYETMDEAIRAGWKPGQSFSFVATNVMGQNVLSDKDVQGTQPLGTVRY